MQELLLYGMSPDNVLYGTDWPILSMASYLQFMSDLKVPLKEKRRIMYENTAALFRIPVPDARGGLSGLFR
jgi:predicted TIM-barrel fold metal-dependent hydrolase